MFLVIEINILGDLKAKFGININKSVLAAKSSNNMLIHIVNCNFLDVSRICFNSMIKYLMKYKRLNSNSI